MSARTPKLRLATENGRRVGRTAKATRFAAKPGTDAARIARSLSEIYTEGCHVLSLAMKAEEVAKLAFTASCAEGTSMTTALTREGNISAGYVPCRISNLLRMMEQAREGTLCA